MIGFLHPWLLAGLAAAGVPVLLHLLARREPPTVIFPAVRYLVNTTREHRNRLRLQHWLLLLLRTLLIVALVLAAAGPTLPRGGAGAGHAPSALVLVVDDSPSSTAVVDGVAVLERLKAAARRVLARATPDDALWLLTADGIPRRGDAATLRQAVDRLAGSPRRLDLGAALGTAGEVLAPEARPGEIVVLSDLQASAVSAARPRVPVTVARPAGAPPQNRGVAALRPGAQPWSTDGGRVTVTLAGDSGAPAPVAVRLGDRPPHQVLLAPGGAATVALAGAPAGWWTVRATLPPDELRADDERVAPVRIAPLARVAWDESERYVAAAAEVLVANRRLARGDEVTLGRLGRGASVVEPPADAAALGALNRALAARGVGWRYGALVTTAAVTDSGPLLGGAAGVRVARRYALEPSGSGRTGVLATVGGAPWLVRGANGVVLLASRLDPAWTELPLQAAFVPFLDALLNRIARGEVAVVDGTPGDPVPLPDLVTEVRREGRAWRAEGGSLFRPPERGVYVLLAGRDTVGALAVNPDPRESALARAEDAALRRLWPGARVVPLDEAPALAFTAGARGDLRGPLLWTALVLGLAEMGVASAWRRRS
ncbi:MAG TPA: BatA and WFA domain-containing protein [Gemmatimonadales bacterium]|nr:BatA and WFA domain-containing protein [Gemmatimonadales bacterium]